MEKPRRGNPPRVMPSMTNDDWETFFIYRYISSGAPRGSGVQSMTSDFGAMSIASSGGAQSSSRSVFHSNVADVQLKPKDKRGTISNLCSRWVLTFHIEGISGDPVNVIANYIKVLTKPQWELFQYHILFSPDVENKRFRREMITQHRVNTCNGWLFSSSNEYCFRLF